MRIPPVDFQHEKEVCGGGAELSTTVSLTAFYRRIEFAYVRSNKPHPWSVVIACLLFAAGANWLVETVVR